MNWNPALFSHNYARLIIYSLLVGYVLFFFMDQSSNASGTNGFDLSNSLVPTNEIHHGGPRRDGIPAIDKPLFVTPEQADFLNPDDRVLGISHNGITKAYAVRILNYHEIVNDKFGSQPVAITYCPLCGTGMAFSTNHSFGVSGLLYNSDMLLYDRQTESLWSQIMKQAITGPQKGKKLKQLPMAHTSWRNWLNQHPNTLALSTKTGYIRNYASTPYPGYELSQDIIFPVSFTSRQYHPKELVIGIEINKKFKAYPFSELAKLKTTQLNDRFAGKPVTIIFDPVNRSGKILNKNGDELPSITSFWFAWIAFHPESEIYKK